MFANYGYPGLNRWVYEKTKCFFDGWRCGKGLVPWEPSPCLAAVPVSRALEEVKSLLSCLERRAPHPAFSAEFEPVPSKSLSSGRRLKVVYSGIRAENYAQRGPGFSFEYQNFYRTLKDMAGVEIIEYQYDPIVPLGRKRFNRELLSLIKAEKPDVFFAFMFSDEFEPATLDEIKKITKSVAWFADDQWRIDNYSRFYAPHFTRAATTWSLAPARYGRYGIKNVIRSQWACNPSLWKPAETAKTIDISFIGRWTKPRANIIGALRRAGLPVFVRGWGWPEGRAPHEEMLRIISSSKISLNLNDPPSLFSPRSLGRLVLRRSLNKLVPSFDFTNNFKYWRNMRVPHIKARSFELAGCGAFVISGLADDAGKYYKENEEMVFYKNKDDLVKKIKYYLKADKEREQMAEAAYKRTLAEHTYEKRLEAIFRMLLRDTK